MNIKKGYTRGELARLTKCPYFIIDYLRNIGALEFITPPKGKGSIALYHPDSINIIKDHLDKQISGDSNEVI